MPAEEYSAPTVELKFIDGVLHQKFMIHGFYGSTFEWRKVPSETTTPSEDALDEIAAKMEYTHES